uniref:DRBM domain-containing protein n=1 Tax=Microcebus murinus TaxID=30608 RepID=A0A8C6EBE8_MICMU
MFSVQLSLGEQTWESEGSSIKKAQQAVANKALTESALPKLVQKPAKSNVNNNPGSITPTVELNGLAMKRGEPAIYRPLDPKPFPNYRANYNFRGMYNQRYHCPMPKIFYQNSQLQRCRNNPHAHQYMSGLIKYFACIPWNTTQLQKTMVI